MQLAKAEDSFLGAAIGQEDVGAVIGLAFSSLCEQVDQRGERFHIGQQWLPLAASGGGRALFGEVPG